MGVLSLVRVSACAAVHSLACGGGDPDAALAGGVLVLGHELEGAPPALGDGSVVLGTQKHTHLYNGPYVTPGHTWTHLVTPGHTWSHLDTPGHSWSLMVNPV